MRFIFTRVSLRLPDAAGGGGGGFEASSFALGAGLSSFGLVAGLLGASADSFFGGGGVVGSLAGSDLALGGGAECSSFFSGGGADWPSSFLGAAIIHGLRQTSRTDSCHEMKRTTTLSWFNLEEILADIDSVFLLR